MVKTAKTSQSQAFIDKARELECEENEGTFDDKLRRIAKAKPKANEKKTSDK